MSVKKAAIFLEGKTESVFVQRLISEIANANDVVFEVQEVNRVLQMNQINDNGPHKYFVLIVDCGGDDAVKSRILDNHGSLIRANYDVVIGLRDVYPIARCDIDKLRRGVYTKVPQRPFPIKIFLAVMEVESWFLQESNHYEEVDARLSPDQFAPAVGFDPRVNNAETDVDSPAQLLNSIYQTVGLAYKKKGHQINRTVSALDYESVYYELPHQLNSLGQFIYALDEFLS